MRCRVSPPLDGEGGAKRGWGETKVRECVGDLFFFFPPPLTPPHVDAEHRSAMWGEGDSIGASL
jgi:hypothetical protein